MKVALANCRDINRGRYVGVIILTQGMIVDVLSILTFQERPIYLAQSDMLAPGAFPFGIWFQYQFFAADIGLNHKGTRAAALV